jgi:hypothetical protein
VDGAQPQPLLRALSREAWRRSPTASLNYDPERDRMLLRLLDAPSVAEGTLETPQPGPNADLFVGFDGVDASAWPTTVAVLGFGSKRARDTGLVTMLRELVGPKVWSAAISLADSSESDLEVEITQAEAAVLISRWQEMIVAFEEIRLTDEALERVLAEWSTTLTLRLVRSSSTTKTMRRSIAVDGDDLFTRLTGRPRRHLEPWPVARIDFDPKGSDYLISVVLPLPELPVSHPAVSAQLAIGDHAWDLMLKFEREQSSPLTQVLIGCRLVNMRAIPAEFIHGDRIDVQLRLRVTAPCHEDPRGG